MKCPECQFENPEGMKFCVECGKEAEIYQNGVCLNCYVKTHKFSTGPDIIDIINCPHCGSYKYKNKWTSESFNNILIRHIKHFFKISEKLKNMKILTECEDEKDRLNCRIFINGILKNINISEEHLLTIRIKNEVCDVCSKRYGGYHEAIIQIRSYKRKLSSDFLEEIKLFVINLVKSLQEKGHRDLFISDIGEEHGDLDFYLSNKGLAYTIIKNIQDNYGGNIKKSSKGLSPVQFAKQLFAYFIDGTDMSMKSFDRRKTDEAYAAALENSLDQMASSHQMKRFFSKFIVVGNWIFRKVLIELFIWRLHIEQPNIIILFGDTMVLDNDDAKVRESVEPTYKKKKGFQPLQIFWGFP